jgi:hypothetical protein
VPPTTPPGRPASKTANHAVAGLARIPRTTPISPPATVPISEPDTAHRATTGSRMTSAKPLTRPRDLARTDAREDLVGSDV